MRLPIRPFALLLAMLCVIPLTVAPPVSAAVEDDDAGWASDEDDEAEADWGDEDRPADASEADAPPPPPPPPAERAAGEHEDTTVYKVVVNHEEQYSIWPADRENALGWNDAGKQGTKAECLACIEEVWTDMRPLSLRKKMEEKARGEQ